LEINNAHPKPFTWIKSADDILASIERFVCDFLERVMNFKKSSFKSTICADMPHG
jgi:hypothetical protein